MIDIAITLDNGDEFCLRPAEAKALYNELAGVFAPPVPAYFVQNTWKRYPDFVPSTGVTLLVCNEDESRHEVATFDGRDFIAKNSVLRLPTVRYWSPIQKAN